MSPYGVSCLTSLSALDYVVMGFTTLLQSLVHLGFILLVWGISCLGLSLSMLDYFSIDLFSLLRSFVKLGLSLLVFGMSQIRLPAVNLGSCSLGKLIILKDPCAI